MEYTKSSYKKYSLLTILKFITLSSIGVFLFMIPIKANGEITIPIAILSSGLQENLKTALPMILFLTIVISNLGTILAKTIKPTFIFKYKFLRELFDVKPTWFIVRILGGIFIIANLFKIGPEFLYNENTGGLIVDSLLPILFSVFLFAGLFLPFLLNFGLLEFVGSLLVKVMRPIFNLPGRSAIDCMASWLGDGTIGVLLTNKQYEDGAYTKREAAVIGTTFSLVSITFSLVVIDTVGLGNMFLPFYFTVTVAGLVAAIIVPRFGPLAKKKDVYIDGRAQTEKEVVPKGYNSFSHGLTLALEKAQSENVIKTIVVNGFKNVIDMWIAVIPIVMAVGTIALVIAEYTPVFRILGLPLLPILALLQIPEAAAASQTLIAGFADMLLPSILAANIESELTRFVLACVSVTQLIYLSEVGALLLGSKIPLNLKELFIIFLQRTIITLPVIAGIAHLIF